jgi:hypothetical protein
MWGFFDADTNEKLALTPQFRGPARAIEEFTHSRPNWERVEATEPGDAALFVHPLLGNRVAIREFDANQLRNGAVYIGFYCDPATKRTLERLARERGLSLTNLINAVCARAEETLGTQKAQAQP